MDKDRALKTGQVKIRNLISKCWLHVCKSTKLMYTNQQIDTGSDVVRWPSTGLCHMPRVGEYCASIAMPPPFEVATTEADSAVQFFEDFAHYLYHVAKPRTLCMSTKLKYTCLNR